MIRPIELQLELPMALSNGAISTTTKVWEVLFAGYQGDIATVKKLVAECPELIYAQYNYTPPIHFAVREGHIELVRYLLEHGAYNPNHKTYPFQDSLLTIAQDREHDEIVLLLKEYAKNLSLHKFKGDNGEIFYNRTNKQKEFEQAVDKEDIGRIEEILQIHPEFALDNTFFWSEGVLMMVAKENNQQLMKLLMSYGAKVPDVLKWTQFYYFEDYDAAVFLMENGMSPNVMSWHPVTLLHDMAQKGFIDKAELLIKHGADINVIDEEYQSTPLGMAARWGNIEMVAYLLSQKADPNKSGASWSTPIEWAKKKNHSEIEMILSKSLH